MTAAEVVKVAESLQQPTLPIFIPLGVAVVVSAVVMFLLAKSYENSVTQKTAIAVGGETLNIGVSQPVKLPTWKRTMISSTLGVVAGLLLFVSLSLAQEWGYAQDVRTFKNETFPAYVANAELSDSKVDTVEKVRDNRYRITYATSSTGADLGFVTYQGEAKIVKGEPGSELYMTYKFVPKGLGFGLDSGITDVTVHVPEEYEIQYSEM